MIVECHGLFTPNKGSCLMAIAVSQELRQRLDEVVLVANPEAGPFVERSKLGFHQTLAFGPWLRPFTRLLTGIPPRDRLQQLGLIPERDIDVVLDISGFRYSDQFGPEKAERAADLAESRGRQGVPVILLPQAMGPFENERTRHAIERLVSTSQLVAIRDPTSHEHLKRVVGEQPHIIRAPDFTNLVAGEIPENLSLPDNLGLVVPNLKVIDKQEGGDGQVYKNFLIQSVNAMKEINLEPYILVHESRDRTLADEVSVMTATPTPVLQYEDPRHLKGILGRSRVVVGSRYHALVSALSQGVPCLGVGWSHKYTHLFKDYGMDDCVITPTISFSHMAERLNDLAMQDAYSSRITKSAQNWKQEASRFWDTVESALS